VLYVFFGLLTPCVVWQISFEFSAGNNLAANGVAAFALKLPVMAATAPNTTQHWVTKALLDNLRYYLKGKTQLEARDLGVAQALVNNFMPTPTVSAVPLTSAPNAQPPVVSQVNYFPETMLAQFPDVRTLHGYLQSPSTLLNRDQRDVHEVFETLLTAVSAVVSYNMKEHPFWKAQSSPDFQMQWMGLVEDFKNWMPTVASSKRNWSNFLLAVMPTKTGKLVSAIEEAGLKGKCKDSRTSIARGSRSRSKPRSNSRSRSPAARSSSRALVPYKSPSSRTNPQQRQNRMPQARCSLCQKSHVSPAHCPRCGKANHDDSRSHSCHVKVDICGDAIDAAHDRKHRGVKYNRLVGRMP
jgi:hypothetical protein